MGIVRDRNRGLWNEAPRWLKVALVLAAAILLVGAWRFYYSQIQNREKEIRSDLEAIAKLKVDQITTWRNERLADAAVLMENSAFVDATAKWIESPDQGSMDLLARLRSLQQRHHFRNVLLVDTVGQVRLSLSNVSQPLPEQVTRTLAAALRDRRPLLTDLYAAPKENDPGLDVVAPMFRRKNSSDIPVGAILFQTDARQFLFPLIQTWPTPSHTAETLLVRREGDSVLFLNELRHRQGTALTLRIPLSQRDVPAVMAVSGRVGVVRGKDYRGIEVLSVLRSVPDSTWFMVAKVDTSEALSALRRESILILALFFGLTVAVVLGLGIVWQRREKVHYRSLVEAEAARERSEERYRITLMSVGDGVIATDAEGRVELLNSVAEALTGCSSTEASGKPVEQVFVIINEKTRAAADNPVRRVLEENRTVELANHTSLISRDGRETPVEDSAAPIIDGEGRTAGVVLVFRDVTERRKADDELKKSRDELEQRVQERTAELRQAYDKLITETKEREGVEARLRQKQKLETVGTLAAGIAHDFNNILAAVIGFSEMARDSSAAGSKVRHRVERALSAGLRGRDLVRQVLAFSRKGDTDKRPLRLASVVEETLRLLRAVVPTTIAIRTSVDSRNSLVFADPVQMEQVLMNLCTNAAYAMRQEGGVMSVRLRACSFASSAEVPYPTMQPANYLQLSVTDTGEGMPPEILERVFDPFFTTKPEGEGTGLGLSVVHGIVSDHGGAITVSSAPGQGSEFSVYLPEHSLAQSHHSESPDETPLGRGECVLFVDDEEALTELGADILTGLGYSVVSVTDGRDAVRAFADTPTRFDLVVTDQTIPGMTGTRVAAEIHALRPDIPIILCTGYISPDFGEQEGISTVLRKPLTKKELARAVRQVLDDSVGRKRPT